MAHGAQCRGAWVRLLLSDTNTGLQTEALRAPDMAVFTCRPQRPPGSPSIRTLCSAGASPHPGLLMLRACGLRGGAFPGTCGGQTPRTGTTAHTGQGSPQAPRQLSRFLGLVLQLDWGGSRLFKRLHQCPWGRAHLRAPTSPLPQMPTCSLTTQVSSQRTWQPASLPTVPGC